LYIRTANAERERLGALDDELGRAFARDALAEAREIREDGTVPEADDALFEELAAAVFHELVVLKAGEADEVGRFAATFGDQRERARGDAATVAFHHRLADVMLPPGEAGDGAKVFAELADSGGAFPSIGIFEDFLDYDGVGREAGDEGIDVAGVERPSVAGEEVVDLDAIGDRERFGF
jgi:hypothetical protein